MTSTAKEDLQRATAEAMRPLTIAGICALSRAVTQNFPNDPWMQPPFATAELIDVDRDGLLSHKGGFIFRNLLPAFNTFSDFGVSRQVGR
jgi:hypothetical protein